MNDVSDDLKPPVDVHPLHLRQHVHRRRPEDLQTHALHLGRLDRMVVQDLDHQLLQEGEGDLHQVVQGTAGFFRLVFVPFGHLPDGQKRVVHFQHVGLLHIGEQGGQQGGPFEGVVHISDRFDGFGEQSPDGIVSFDQQHVEENHPGVFLVGEGEVDLLGRVVGVVNDFPP